MKQIIKLGYLLLEPLDLLQKFLLNNFFFLQMPYELLLQGRKLNKREMGEGVLTRVEGKGGGWKTF